MSDFFNAFLIFYEQGGYVMPPLVLITVILWYAIGYRFHALKRGNRRDVRKLIEKYGSGYERKPTGIIDNAVVTGMEIARTQKADLRRYLDEAFFVYEMATSKYSKLIITLVSVAPLAGLLGTVTGMIETFNSLGDMSLFSQSGGIAGGISQALFTTQMGLVIAVPGLIIGRMLDRRGRDFGMELDQIKDILCAEHAESEINRRGE